MISLAWASANFDDTIFTDPERIQIDRKPNPHVAFGNGPHNCLGAPHARLIVRTLLKVISEQTNELTLISQQPKIEKTSGYERVNGFENLHLSFHR